MAHGRVHYERAVLALLRDHHIPHLDVNEARKTLVPPGEGADERLRGLKSFDVLLRGRDGSVLLEIKGRRIHPARPVYESWVTLEDVRSLLAWLDVLGPGFDAWLAFAAWCDAPPPDALFDHVFVHQNRWYTLRVVDARAYAQRMRTRSLRWGTVHLSRSDFDRMSHPAGPELLRSGRIGGAGHGPVSYPGEIG